MEILFVCPKMQKDFSTSRWSIEGKLETVFHKTGQKSLDGKVKAYCPYCQDEHVFRPDDLPCPFTS